MRLTKEQITEITKALADQGLIIEAGWKGYELGVVPVDAGTLQRQETRWAFYAGAAHLYASIMNMLEPGEEETPADLRRMAQIHEELERFNAQFKLRVDRGGSC